MTSSSKYVHIIVENIILYKTYIPFFYIWKTDNMTYIL